MLLCICGRPNEYTIRASFSTSNPPGQPGNRAINWRFCCDALVPFDGIAGYRAAGGNFGYPDGQLSIIVGFVFIIIQAMLS
jgi:hypothetical protein